MLVLSNCIRLLCVSSAFNILPRRLGDKISALCQHKSVGPTIIGFSMVLNTILSVLSLGAHPRENMFEYASCLGPELAGTLDFPHFLPDQVFTAVFLVYVIVGALHMISMLLVILILTNHNVKVGPLIGRDGFLQRKQKNLMSFKQELLVYAIHVGSIVGYGMMINMTYEESLRVVPIYRGVIWLLELMSTLLMCPELRFSPLLYKA